MGLERRVTIGMVGDDPVGVAKPGGSTSANVRGGRLEMVEMVVVQVLDLRVEFLPAVLGRGQDAVLGVAAFLRWKEAKRYMS